MCKKDNKVTVKKIITGIFAAAGIIAIIPVLAVLIITGLCVVLDFVDEIKDKLSKRKEKRIQEHYITVTRPAGGVDDADD